MEIKVMRDVLIEQVYQRMRDNKNIFFLCADFGSPKLDKLKNDFRDRFINVGIAEQNLINVSTGLALEGFTVFAYAIAPFLTMRAYEQIRINLSLHAQLKEINVNLVGVGAGLSYDVSGPTHHCLEDIAIMKVLPNMEVFSPSDWVLTKGYVDYAIKVKKPKYIRLDGKPLPQIYNSLNDFKFAQGFCELKKGKKLCLASTGFMTHKALEVTKILSREDIDIGVVDVFLIKPLNEALLMKALSKYQAVITLEEGFINNGGLDNLVLQLINRMDAGIKFKNMGFSQAFCFDIGSRDYLHKLNKLDAESIIKNIKGLLRRL
ncbi:MAG: transketolase C-terminal domain-containing protein [Candidatus Omnitrophota bacterium]|nr:transketolase C-terminal domain-containing protein [Candidatus Omnitrophota bacterium]